MKERLKEILDAKQFELTRLITYEKGGFSFHRGYINGEEITKIEEEFEVKFNVAYSIKSNRIFVEFLP